MYCIFYLNRLDDWLTTLFSRYLTCLYFLDEKFGESRQHVDYDCDFDLFVLDL